MMKKIIDNITKITPKLIIFFLYMQPFLDILASILINNNLNNFITSGIRIIFMIYLIIYLVLTKYKDKKKVLIYISLIITYILIHTGVTLYYKDPSVLLYELKNTLSTLYFVFLLIAFFVIYKQNKFDIKHLKNLFIMYVLLTFIPNILGISFDSYTHSKVGSVGWFYSANVLGSIIVILLPTILPKFKDDNKLTLIFLLLSTLYVMFSIGTKTPVLGMLIIIGINMLYFLYRIIKNKNKKAISITGGLFIISFALAILIVPKTSFFQNLKIHYNYLEKEGVSVKSKEFLDHFIFSQRLSMEETTRKAYINSHTLEKIFGIGYIENYGTSDESLKIIEIDYFDILYREGIVGFILYFIPVIYLIVLYFKNTSLDFKGINKLCTLLLILLLALFQGHIFLTPAISIFVALLLVINSINKEKTLV